MLIPKIRVLMDDVPNAPIHYNIAINAHINAYVEKEREREREREKEGRET